MISVQKNFLFIHVPKTGGNSIQNILREYSEDKITTSERQDGLEQFGVENETFQTKKHFNLAQYQERVDPDLFKRLFKFATIRNPWDRMISDYFSPHRNMTEFDRTEFINLASTRRTLRYFIRKNTFLEKVSLRLNLPGDIFIKDLDADIDFLVRFEHIDEDFATLCQKLDIPHTPLPVRNKSSRAHYSTYYDDELVELVRDKFREEIEYGHYQFETT